MPLPVLLPSMSIKDGVRVVSMLPVSFARESRIACREERRLAVGRVVSESVSSVRLKFQGEKQVVWSLQRDAEVYGEETTGREGRGGGGSD